jgi:hypothetical protein
MRSSRAISTFERLPSSWRRTTMARSMRSKERAEPMPGGVLRVRSDVSGLTIVHPPGRLSNARG